MAVTQQVMCAQAGASGRQAFWGAPLESRGVSGMLQPGGVGILVRQGISGRQILPPKRAPRQGGRPHPDPLALHPLVPHPTGPGAGGGILAHPYGIRRLGLASP